MKALSLALVLCLAADCLAQCAGGSCGGGNRNRGPGPRPNGPEPAIEPTTPKTLSVSLKENNLARFKRLALVKPTQQVDPDCKECNKSKTSDVEVNLGGNDPAQHIVDRMARLEAEWAKNKAECEAAKRAIKEARDGQDGIPGEPGEPGPQGPQGPPGQDGTSADMAVLTRITAIVERLDTRVGDLEKRPAADQGAIEAGFARINARLAVIEARKPVTAADVVKQLPPVRMELYDGDKKLDAIDAPLGEAIELDAQQFKKK